MNNPYNVSFLTDARTILKSIAREASVRGQRARYSTALKTIMSELSTQPRECGEPLYTLRHIKLQIRMITVSPLSFVYGVHEQKPVVIVRNVVNMQPFENA